MSANQTPSKVYGHVFGTGETLKLGRAVFARDFELASIALTILKKGTLAGSEQMRVLVYPNSDFETAVATSAWLSLNGLVTSTGAWTGRLKFTFDPRYTIDGGTTAYYIGAQTQNYTRNGTTLFLAARLDWGDALRASPPPAPPAQMSFTGYERQT